MILMDGKKAAYRPDVISTYHFYVDAISLYINEIYFIFKFLITSKSIKPTNDITNKNRIESLDLLKGIVMIIMALDHTRDYFNASAFLFSPSDPTKSTLAIFLQDL